MLCMYLCTYLRQTAMEVRKAIKGHCEWVPRSPRLGRYGDGPGRELVVRHLAHVAGRVYVLEKQSGSSWDPPCSLGSPAGRCQTSILAGHPSVLARFQARPVPTATHPYQPRSYRRVGNLPTYPTFSSPAGRFGRPSHLTMDSNQSTALPQPQPPTHAAVHVLGMEPTKNPWFWPGGTCELSTT